MQKIFGKKEKEKNGKVFIGKSFVFVYPEQVIEVNKEKRTIKTPIIIPRFGNNIKVLGEDFPAQTLDKLELFSITSDKRIYKKDDIANILIAYLNNPNSEVRMEVHRNHQFMYSDTIILNNYGNALYEIGNLEEGNYKIVAILAKERSEVEFNVAEYTLSPLQAICESFVIEDNLIKADLQVTVLNQPFTGELEVGLFCAFCNAVVTTGKCRVENGISKAFKISISGHTGPFTLQLSTSDGKTASVFLQGTRTEEKEEILINPLGMQVMASLAPRKDSNPIKEMYYRTTGTTNTPFIIEKAIADLVHIKSTTSFNKVAILRYAPATNETEIIEKVQVENGDIIEIENNAPYSLLLIGGLNETAYEGYSVIFKPDELQVTLEVPDSALPSSSSEVNIKTNKKANCILLCYDQRLEHVDLNKNLAKQVFTNIKDNLQQGLRERFINDDLASKQKREEEERERRELILERERMEDEMDSRDAMRGLGRLRGRMTMKAEPSIRIMDSVIQRSSLFSGAISEYEMEEEEITLATQPDQLRLDFPELIYCESFEVENKITKFVQLGDQIGTWKFQLYAFSGFDYVEDMKTTVATKDTFVEVDTPAFIAQGDSCFVDIIYNSPKEADNLLVVEGIQSMEKRISGSGVERIEINKSGELRVKLIAPYFTDEVVKYVGMPCVEKVTTSQLYLMEAGEELKDFKSAVIYPSLSALIEDTVDSLIQYPFGCAEQTSSKLCGLGIIYKGIKSGAIDRDIKEVEKLINIGLNRMKLFYRGGSFSLWEGGNPEVQVTSMVLRNLMPFSELEFTDASEMIQTSANTLLESGVKDTRLVSINKKFYNGIDCVEDAVSVYIGEFPDLEKENALKYIIKNANSENGRVYWTSNKAWTKLETTLEALKALYIAGKHELFSKGFAHISSKLVNGRLFTTTDTRALVELFSTMKMDSIPTIIQNGKEIIIENPIVVNNSFTAKSDLIVRVDEDKYIDYTEISSNFQFEVKVQKYSGDISTQFALGERLQIIVTPKEQTIAPLCKVYLPACLAFLKGGASAQTIYEPIKNNNLVIDAIATRKGKCGLYVLMHDMYDSDKIGVAPRIEIKVK